MASQVTNYKCPACTGPLHFVGASGQLECDYCGAHYEVAEIEKLYAEKESAAVDATKQAQAQEEKRRRELADMEAQGWDTSGMTSDWGAEGEGMKAYSCPSCGAELICDATTAATSCPGPLPTQITSRRSRACTSPSGCSTARRRAAPTMRA